jgi:hypothetical protein
MNAVERSGQELHLSISEEMSTWSECRLGFGGRIGPHGEGPSQDRPLPAAYVRVRFDKLLRRASGVSCTVRTSHIYNDHEKPVNLWRRYLGAHRTSLLTKGAGGLCGFR